MWCNETALRNSQCRLAPLFYNNELVVRKIALRICVICRLTSNIFSLIVSNPYLAWYSHLARKSIYSNRTTIVKCWLACHSFMPLLMYNYTSESENRMSLASRTFNAIAMWLKTFALLYWRHWCILQAYLWKYHNIMEQFIPHD